MMSFGSTANMKDLLRKVTLDVELGREQVQLVYTPIYDAIRDGKLTSSIRCELGFIW